MKSTPHSAFFNLPAKYYKVMTKERWSQRRWIAGLWLTALLWLLNAQGSALAQQNGDPSAFLGSDGLYNFSSNGTLQDEYGNSYGGDFYQGVSSNNSGNQSLIDGGGNLWGITYYDDGQGYGVQPHFSETGVTYNPNNTPQFSSPPYVAVTTDYRSFVGLPPGVTVDSNYTLGSLFDGSNYYYPAYSFTNPNSGTVVSVFLNLPTDDVFVIDASPYYLFNGSGLSLDQSSGTWPSSNNLFPAPPPNPVYTLVAGDASAVSYTLGVVNVSSGAGWYTEELDYFDPSGNYDLTIHRYFNNRSYSGDVSGTADGWENYSGTFDPINVVFSNISNPDIQISSSTLNNGGNLRQGPIAISWDGTLVLYQSSDGSGNDYYQDGTGNVNVTINGGSSTSGYNGLRNSSISGTFNSSTSTFSVVNPLTHIRDLNFFAFGTDGNPIGLPPGLILIFGSQGPGAAVIVSNSDPQIGGLFIMNPNFTYQRRDGSWVTKYSLSQSEAEGYNRTVLSGWDLIIADATGLFNSPPYITNDTSNQDQVINAVSGWPLSNAFPPQIYVNGAAYQINWLTDSMSSSITSPFLGTASGGVDYYGPGSTSPIMLTWTWNRGFVSWNLMFTAGPLVNISFPFDGVNTFSNVPFGWAISVNPPPAGPSQGRPASVNWNGTLLTYNGTASVLDSGDVYQATASNGNITQLIIGYGGSVGIYEGRPGVAVPFMGYTGGTYNSISGTFDFGTQNIGTITALNTNNLILSTSSNIGSLDVPGNSISLGTWIDSGNESEAGFVLSFSPPPASSQPALLQFGSMLAQSNWIWSRSTSDGSTSQQAAMTLDQTNRLLLYNPANQTTPAVTIDPVNGVSSVVPVRVLPAGDINMGTFQSGPQPGQ